MEKKVPNYIPALVFIVGIVALAAVCGIIALRHPETTIQGEVEVEEYRVSSKIPGRILRLMAEEGQRVKAGDTLAILEAPEVEAKLQQAEAAEQAADAVSRKAQKGARDEQVRAAYEMWQKAKAGAEVMEKSYKRIRHLYDEGVTTAQKLDEITAQRDAAIATERAAKAQYDMAKNGAQQEDREAARAQKSRAEGAVREVNSYLRESVLIAQMNGEVTDVFPVMGELVGTGAPVMNVALMDKMWLTFNIREDFLADIRVGQEVKAVIPALGDREITAKVTAMKDLGTFAAWKATKTTGQYDRKTFQVKAVPTTPVEGLRPGMTVLLRND
ncbi:MAG: HlyD family secretion protein [Alloprevotella sp.]